MAIYKHFTDSENSLYILKIVGIIFLVASCLCRLHWSAGILLVGILGSVFMWHIYNTIPHVSEYNLTNNYYDNPIWIFLMLV
jgi:uncharacterized membrane protein